MIFAAQLADKLSRMRVLAGEIYDIGLVISDFSDHEMVDEDDTLSLLRELTAHVAHLRQTADEFFYFRQAYNDEPAER